MDTRQELRRSKVRIAMVGFALTVVGGATMAGGKILSPVLDAEGNQIYRSDGSVVTEFNRWENFKYNWMSYTIGAIGFGAIVWGIGSWLYVGLRPRREMNLDSEAG
jgi:hypothetical protein